MAELLCPACGPAPADPGVWRCPGCLGPLELAAWARPAAAWPSAGEGVWRYRDWLPLERTVSLGEPTTALVEAQAGRSGRTLCKLEGAQPTGSFKDRGSAALVASLVASGVRGIVVDSSGNAGASLAAYCAAAGLSARVYVPAGASPAKLVQIEAYGAELVPVPGTRADVAMAATGGADGELVYASHIWSPFFLVGTQTFAFELIEQLEGRTPDAILFPLGAGTLMLGASLGLSALRDAGLIERVPRLVGVQTRACAPFRAAWTGGEDEGCGRSLAEGLLIASPPRLAAVVEAARATGGEIVAVGEVEIERAVLELARQGIYAEPSAAVAYAGLTAAVLPPDADVVVALTATGLKATPAIEQLLRAS